MENLTAKAINATDWWRDFVRFALFAFVALVASVAFSYGSELGGSLGLASYEVEGAGPGGTLWEEKPSYSDVPYVELMFYPASSQERRPKLFPSKIEADFLFGKDAAMPDQAIRRKVETASLWVSWNWLLGGGFGFGLGPMAVGQRHRVADANGRGCANHSIARAGSHFSWFWLGESGSWRAEASWRIGIAGWPPRQSAANLFSFGLGRRLSAGKTFVGFKAVLGVVQLERGDNLTGAPGTATNAILLFKQEMLDYKAIMLTLSHRI